MHKESIKQFKYENMQPLAGIKLPKKIKTPKFQIILKERGKK